MVEQNKPLMKEDIQYVIHTKDYVWGGDAIELGKLRRALQGLLEEKENIRISLNKDRKEYIKAHPEYEFHLRVAYLDGQIFQLEQDILTIKRWLGAIQETER